MRATVYGTTLDLFKFFIRILVLTTIIVLIFYQIMSTKVTTNNYILGHLHRRIYRFNTCGLRSSL